LEQETSGLSLIEVERETLGFDHAELGAEMAKRWNFPTEIERVIQFWRTPDQYPFLPIAGLVYVAVFLEQGLTGNALIEVAGSDLCRRLNLDWDRIQQCLPQKMETDSLVNLMLDR
jgi:HD-like signal output (HDOD) protein